MENIKLMECRVKQEYVVGWRRSNLFRIRKIDLFTSTVLPSDKYLLSFSLFVVASYGLIWFGLWFIVFCFSTCHLLQGSIPSVNVTRKQHGPVLSAPFCSVHSWSPLQSLQASIDYSDYSISIVLLHHHPFFPFSLQLWYCGPQMGDTPNHPKADPAGKPSIFWQRGHTRNPSSSFDHWVCTPQCVVLNSVWGALCVSRKLRSTQMAWTNSSLTNFGLQVLKLMSLAVYLMVRYG